MNDLLQIALGFFERGYPVIGVNEDKEPYRKWKYILRREKTQTEADVRREFANGAWGLAGILYPACNYVHLDFDGRHSEAAWETTGISLPETARFWTRSGYYHLVFLASDLLRKTPIRVKRGVRIVEADCDCTKDGEPKPCGVDFLVNGIAVLPGSPGYREDPDWPLESAVGLPDELVKLALRKQQEKERSARNGKNGNGKKIPAGKRNATLTSIAGSMRRRGMEYEDILQALLKENEARCEPPLPESEVEKIANSVMRYEPEKLDIKYLTDFGNAERLVALAGEDIRHCYEDGWHVWNGKVWPKDKTGRIVQLAKEMVRGIYREAASSNDDELRQKIAAHAKKSESRDRISAAVALAESEPGVPILITEFDTDLRLFNCFSGGIEPMAEITFREHRREDYMTQMSPVTYDPNADCPRWKTFMTEIMNDDEKLIAFLKRSVGYSLTGLTTEQCFWVLFGSGSNGKSTFVNTILKLMGDYGCQVKTEILLESRNETTKEYHLAELRGKRFVVASESNMRRKLAAGLLKQATGSDRIPAREPYGRPFDFLPQFKLWLCTNHRPKIDDQTESMWRRIHAVPFSVQFKRKGSVADDYQGKLVDAELPSKLEAELPGILNWAIEGCRDWQKQGLNPPESIRNATEEYRQEEDVIGAFLSDCCEADPMGWEYAEILYARYKDWCERNGERPETQTGFGTMLGERGFAKGKRNEKRTREGIGLIKIKTSDDKQTV